MYIIGRMHQYGQGVKIDYKEAFNWYEKAANKNNALAELSLGFLYDSGQGVKQDYKISKTK